ncbi:hypothetical protein EA187_08680 [Lujinxingia sediminis]|uniref:Outer membrane protein beta-barrel domain-containing protein n=1 Tax=Lujinxingia sediminis TaxID=2480984 RepID=A0ABY0CU25_9DELT|nr:hypothetical protein EA187_08680 [Lujinxingia sediminis]
MAEKGDLGVLGGYDFVTANLGLSARAYPGEGWMLGVQVEGRRDVWRSRDTSERPDPVADRFVVTSRISSAVRKRGGAYVGVEGTLLSARFYNSETETSTLRLWGVGFGGFVGAERRLSKGWSLQAEMMLRPLLINMYYEQIDVFEFMEEGIGFQGSVGVNYRFGGGDAQPPLRPSEAVPGEGESGENESGENESGEDDVSGEDGVPKYGEEGVPLY